VKNTPQSRGGPSSELFLTEEALGGSLPNDLRMHYLQSHGGQASAFQPFALKDVRALHAEDGWQKNVLVTRYHMVRFYPLDERSWAGTWMDSPLSGYLFRVERIAGTSTYTFHDQLWPDFKTLQHGASVYPTVGAYTQRDRGAFRFLQDLVETRSSFDEGERPFLIALMARLCPPHRWRDLVAYFDESTVAVRILAQIYFCEMLPSMVAQISVDAAAHHEVFEVLAKGVFVFPELESEVCACLTRQGVDRSYFMDTLNQIKRWPTLVDQW
jgi:hypothetical protein